MAKKKEKNAVEVNVKELKDAELVVLTLQDDSEEFFEELIERYERKLLRYVMRISYFDFAEAEDILQEVFLKVYHNLNEFDDEFAFSSWIYRITRNFVISQVRKNKSRPNVVRIDDEFAESLIERLPSEIDLPRDFVRKELKERVRSALAKLPEKYREVLVLYYLEEQSYAEISDILKRSVNSVSVQINRAKKKLRGMLT